MSHQSLTEGAHAFERGEPRTANPFDADGEDWLCWRDGWEQAKASVEKLVAASESPQETVLP